MTTLFFSCIVEPILKDHLL